MGRLYYETTICHLIRVEIHNDTKGAFEEYLMKLDIVRELQLTDSNGFDVSKYCADEDTDEDTWVWNIDEDWKHELVDRLASTTNIDYIDEMLSGIGFRNVFKIVNDTGMFDDITMDDLSTDLGMRRLFYGVLDYHLHLWEDDETEYQKQITKEKWDEWEGRNEWSDHGDSEDEDDEDDEDEIVPITDEALDRIGGLVARCA